MKYMGSKERIADEILNCILPLRCDNQTFVDAFCGGCSISQRVNGKVISNDANKYLIAMWKDLQNGVDFPKRIEKDFYDDVRVDWRNHTNKFTDGMIGWVGFMASFNGRFFDGGYSSHNYNGRDYISEQIRNTLSQVPLLKHTDFVSGSYDEISIPDNSIIYCDIPYKGTKQYSTSKGFNYDKFYDWCRIKHKEGNKIFVSEYNMPDDFICVWQKSIKNTLNPTKTTTPIEKLFTLGNYTVTKQLSLF